MPDIWFATRQRGVTEIVEGRSGARWRFWCMPFCRANDVHRHQICSLRLGLSTTQMLQLSLAPSWTAPVSGVVHVHSRLVDQSGLAWSNETAESSAGFRLGPVWFDVSSPQIEVRTPAFPNRPPTTYIAPRTSDQCNWPENFNLNY